MAAATPIGPQHVGVLEPNVEGILSPDHMPVSVTAHGIAAVREIEIKSQIYNESQMQFNRLFSPSDLIDRTWLLSFPVEVEYDALENLPATEDFHTLPFVSNRKPWGGVQFSPNDMQPHCERATDAFVAADSSANRPAHYNSKMGEVNWKTENSTHNPSGLAGNSTKAVKISTEPKIDVLRNMMMAKKLGVTGDMGDVKVAPNAFSRMTTHCVLTLNNGTLSSQPYMENLPKAYYTDPDEVQQNDGLDRPFTSTIPYLAGEGLLSTSTEQSNALQNHTVGSFPIQAEDGVQAVGTTTNVVVTMCSTTASALTTPAQNGIAKQPDSVKRQEIVRSYGPEELLCQKTLNGDSIKFALQDLGRLQQDVIDVDTPFYDDYSMAGLSVHKVKVTYNITVPVDHPLLQNAAGDECLCNVRNMDLKIGYKDILKSLYLPRQVDFTLGGKTYKGYPSFVERNDLGDYKLLGDNHYLGGKYTPNHGGLTTIENWTPKTVQTGTGDKTTDKTLSMVPWGLSKESLQNAAGVPYPWDKTLPTITRDIKDDQAAHGITDAGAGVHFPEGIEFDQTIRSPYAGFQVIPYGVRAKVTGEASLRLRLYQSAVPVPRSISIPTNTYIVRQTSSFASKTMENGRDLSSVAIAGNLSTFGGGGDVVSNITTKSGCQFTFQTDSYSLSEVPLKMYIFVAGQRLDGEESTGNTVTGDKMSTPDKLLRITEANFRTTANTGTLSAATHRQLYEMCKRNGLNIPMEQFLYDGNVLCIRPSRDLGGWVEGSRETFTHDFKIVADIPGSTEASFNSLLARMRSTKPPSGAGPLALDCFSGGGTSDLRKLLSNELAVLRDSIKDPTLYVVYEMAGQTMLQADGQMMTTSGIDTSTIIGSLEGSGLRHSAELGGGVSLSSGGSIFSSAMKVGNRAAGFLMSHAKSHLAQAGKAVGHAALGAAKSQFQEMLG